MKRILSLMFAITLLCSVAFANVTDQTQRVQYTATASQTIFVYTWRVLDDGDMDVFVDDVLTTAYSVSNVGVLTGGNVTFNTGRTAGEIITIIRNMPNSQETIYPAGGRLSTVNLELNLDRLTMFTQDLAEEMGRATKFPTTSTLKDIDFPASSSRGSQLIRWKADGTALEEVSAQTIANQGTSITTDIYRFIADPTQADHGLSTTNSIKALIDTIGSVEESILLPPGTYNFGTSETVPANVTLIVQDGSVITIANGITVTINGKFKTGLFKVFSLTGTGLAVFGTQGNVKDIRPQWWGAIGDGSTASGVATLAALTAAAAAKSSLVFSAGDFNMGTTPLAISSANAIKMQGAGSGLTILTWTSGEGISLTFTDALFPAVVNGMSLHTDGGGGTALLITGPESASLTILGPSVIDVDIRGTATITDWWDIGAHFFTCWYITLTEVNVKGKDDASSPFDATAGIKMSSCQVCYMSKFGIFHVGTGILEAASGGPTHGEGFSFSDFEIVGCTTGISLAADGNAPGTNIGPGHTNTSAFGITMTNQFQTSIHDMLIYKTASESNNYVGINLIDCDSNHIHDNDIHGGAGATGTMGGIVLTGTTVTDDNNIHDNQFRDFIGTSKVGITVGTGAGTNRLHNNHADGTVTTTLVFNTDAEKNNIAKNNFPTTIQTFVADDLTPSVGNDLNGLFNTNNGSAKTITTFDDGYIGQIIHVLVNDANTTFEHNGTGITLEGSVNFVAGNGSILTLRQDVAGGLWREMSRRTP